MVRAMGGKIGVTSDQKGKGTRVTVSVPLENRQSGPDRRKSATEDDAAAARVLGDVTVGLITKVRASSKSRQEVLVATAASMAAASVENNCKHLGAVSEHCNLDDSKRYDVKIVMEPDLEACIDLVRSARTSFGRGNIAPMVVVCNSSPTAQTHRDLWTSNELSNDVVAEFISLPCGTKQIARAVKSALALQKELMETFNDDSRTAATAQAPEGATNDDVLQNAKYQSRPGEHPTAHPVKQSEDSGTGPSVDSITLVSTRDESRSEHPPTPSDGREDSSPAVPFADLTSLPLEEQQAHPHVLRWPSATTMLTYPLRSQAATLQDSAIIQSPESQMSELTEASAPRPGVESGPEAAKGPSLLLVDDNSINLRLLTTFATKRKYPFISALDGQLAVDAFENAHKIRTPPKGSQTSF